MTRQVLKICLVLAISFSGCAEVPVKPMRWYMARPSKTVPPGGMSRAATKDHPKEFISWWDVNGWFCTDAEGVRSLYLPPPMEGPPL